MLSTELALKSWGCSFVTAHKQLYFHDVILLCPMTSKLGMMLVDVIPCGDFKCHWVLNSFELVLNSNKLAKERWLGSFPICMCAPLNPKVGIAQSFPFSSLLKTLHPFLDPPKVWVPIQSEFEFQNGPTFLLLQKVSNQFYKMENIARV